MKDKILIIDTRMRKEEKDKLEELGYKLIPIEPSKNVYTEISSHVDIFACKIGEKIVLEKSQYKQIKKQLFQNKNIEQGDAIVQRNYPDDIKYNVCTIGKKALHNFKYTDSKIKEELIKQKYDIINTNQGYTNCSIAVIDDMSAIVTDKGLYKILKKHGIDVLYIKEELDIKLIANNEYSNKKGFIGGAISRVGNKIIIFGDLNKIDNNGTIRNFIIGKNLEIIEFKNLDVIDYGGIIEIN